MKGKVIGATLLVGALLSGCGGQNKHPSQAKSKSTVPLAFTNVKDKTAKTNKDGDFVLKGTTKPGSKITSLNSKPVVAKTKHFSIKVSLPSSKKWDTIEIDAYHKGYKMNYDVFNLDNHSTAYKNRIASKKAKAKTESIADEKKAKREEAQAQAKTARARAAKQAKINRDYPTVASVYGAQQLTSFSTNKLTHGVRLTSSIVDLGADGMSNYHVLLKANGTYVLMVEDRSKTGKLAQGDTLTVYGMFNGKGRINENQINSGISSSYYTEPCVLLMADKVVNHDE